jgi:hypothetical protein
MNIVEQKKIENVRYLFGSPSTVKSRYNQLKRTFPEIDDYKIFAEPVFIPDSNTIIWSTEFNGNIINYSKLSPTDQTIAEKLLSKSIQNILKLAKTFNTEELSKFIYNCIEIPSMNNIFLIRGQGNDKVVITEWGFVSDTPGMEKGLLAKIINVKRTNMTFDVIYTDNKEPAPNQKFNFDFEQHTETHISDENGKIILNDVKIDEEVEVYQDNNNKQKFICYEAGKYKLQVERKINIQFLVLDSENKAVENANFTFEYNNQTKSLSSNEQGKIILPDIKIGTEIIAYQDKKEDAQKFICQKDKKEYILRIKKPEYTLKFKVVDPDGEIVPNAKVKVKYGNQKIQLTTDNNGYAILKNLKPGMQVKVVAIGKKTKKNKAIKTQIKEK